MTKYVTNSVTKSVTKYVTFVVTNSVTKSARVCDEISDKQRATTVDNNSGTTQSTILFVAVVCRRLYCKVQRNYNFHILFVSFSCQISSPTCVTCVAVVGQCAVVAIASRLVSRQRCE